MNTYPDTICCSNWICWGEIRGLLLLQCSVFIHCFLLLLYLIMQPGKERRSHSESLQGNKLKMSPEDCTVRAYVCSSVCPWIWKFTIIPREPGQAVHLSPARSAQNISCSAHTGSSVLIIAILCSSCLLLYLTLLAS